MDAVEKIAELLTAVIEREKPDNMSLMAISNSWGPVEIQVDQAYFDKHFEGAGVEVSEHSRSYDQHSWTTPSGAKVFCLKAASWERVA
jgi:hypothetical protein